MLLRRKRDCDAIVRGAFVRPNIISEDKKEIVGQIMNSRFAEENLLIWSTREHYGVNGNMVLAGSRY